MGKKSKNKKRIQSKPALPPVPAGNRAALSYDATKTDRARRPVMVSSRSEDKVLDARGRSIVISDARDAVRNFTLAGFVVRKHLQSIAYYRFSAGTPDRAFNDQLERLIKRWSRRENCDAARRHSFDELINLIEFHRAVDGDVGILALASNHIQIIEGDRIRTPMDKIGAEDWFNGVKVNKYGRALKYGIARRTPAGFEDERIIDADNLRLIGYYIRQDQIRGVSLHAPAANLFAKLYESVDLALAKQKLEQCMGLATILNEPSLNDPMSLEGRRDEINQRLTDTFGGITNIELVAGEDIKAFESNNPSSNFQAFCEQVLRMVFAAYDIPYSFYDGSKTNYYGSEGEFEQYIDSIERKQKPTIEALNEITFGTLIPNWIAEGRITLPSGWDLEDLADDSGWSGAGLPSWRMYRHIKDLIPAISAGMISPEYAAGEYGFSLRKNIDDLAEAVEYGREKGLELPFGSVKSTNLGL